MITELKISIAAAALILLPLTCAVGDDSVARMEDSFPIQFTAKWETGNRVKKLYETPLGAVYEFSSHSYNIFHANSIIWHEGKHKNCNACKTRDKLKDQFYSIQTQLFKSESMLRKQSRRYIVIDFKVRLFPVKKKPLKREAFSHLNFVFWTSDKLNQVSDLTELNSLQYLCNSHSYCSKYTDHDENDPSRQPYFYNCANIIPYEVHNCRIIRDTQNSSDRIQATNYDGIDISIKGELEENVPRYPIKSIGIFLVKSNDKDQLLELSDPVIRLIDSEEELKKLPVIKALVYPYEGYSASGDKKKKIRNPDKIYAQAMCYLSGDGAACDFVEAVQLLRKAAGMDHVFAMYQLGVCYYRGIGVPVDYEQSAKWLRKAIALNLDDARALKGILLMAGKIPIQKFKYADFKDECRSLFEIGQHNNNGHNIRLAGMITGVDAAIESGYDYTQSSKMAYWTGIKMLPIEQSKTLSEIIPQIDVWVQKYGLFPFYPDEPNPGQTNGVALCRMAYEWIDLAIKLNFSPAMLFKGLILNAPQTCKWVWKKEADEQIVLDLFERGAALGNADCKLQAMRLKAGRCKLKQQELDDAAIGHVELLEKPFYYLLQYSLKQPDAAWSKAFLRNALTGAYNLCANQKSTEADFLAGALKLAYLEHKRIYWRMLSDFFSVGENKKEFETGVELLTKAANSGNVPALYLVGKMQLDGKKLLRDYSSGKAYLERAAAVGHYGAQLELAKELIRTGDRRKALNYLKQPCQTAKFPEAWRLLGELWNTDNGRALAALRKAAELGDAEAWNMLGMAYYNGQLGLPRDKALAAECWQKFLKLDTRRRNQDPWDLYWGAPRLPQVVLDRYGLPLQVLRARYYSVKTQKEYYDTFK